MNAFLNHFKNLTLTEKLEFLSTIILEPGHLSTEQVKILRGWTNDRLAKRYNLCLLPLELILRILKFLSFKQLLLLRLVNKQWYRVTLYPELWILQLSQHFPTTLLQQGSILAELEFKKHHSRRCNFNLGTPVKIIEAERLHEARITGICFSPNYLVIGSYYRRISVYRQEYDKITFLRNIECFAIFTLALNEEANLICATGKELNRGVVLFELTTGNLVKTINVSNLHTALIIRVLLSPRYIATIGNDMLINVFDLLGMPIAQFGGGVGNPITCCWIDAHLLLIVEESNDFYIGDIDNNALITITKNYDNVFINVLSEIVDLSSSSFINDSRIITLLAGDKTAIFMLVGVATSKPRISLEDVYDVAFLSTKFPCATSERRVFYIPHNYIESPKPALSIFCSNGGQLISKVQPWCRINQPVLTAIAVYEEKVVVGALDGRVYILTF